MGKKRRKPDEFDSPWKDVLQAYLPAFLAFFFPDIVGEIDWVRGYVALDKEFQQIARRAKIGKLLADKLFKVWLKDGREHWLLIHIEIQGEVESEFPRRMFDYHVAARQLYNQEVVSLAILCDENPHWKPTVFEYGRWGTWLSLTFRVAKLLEFGDDLEALEASENPFAAVVLAHLQTMRTRDDPTSRREWKLRIIKALFRNNWQNDDIRRLFRVIDWLMALPEDLEDLFRADLYRLEEERKVEYITSIERHGIKVGIERGLRKGRRLGRLEGLEEGIEKGIEKGQCDAFIEVALSKLNERFGAAGFKLADRIRAIDSADELRQLIRVIGTAKSLQDVRDQLN